MDFFSCVAYLHLKDLKGVKNLFLKFGLVHHMPLTKNEPVKPCPLSCLTIHDPDFRLIHYLRTNSAKFQIQSFQNLHRSTCSLKSVIIILIFYRPGKNFEIEAYGGQGIKSVVGLSRMSKRKPLRLKGMQQEYVLFQTGNLNQKWFS